MTRRYARLVGLTVLAVAVVRTPSDALQETPTLQQITEVHIRADAGDAAAQVTLGGMYFAGRGVPQDAVEAVRVSLGVMYADGRGVAQDDVKAHMWLDLAAARSTGELQESVIRSRDTVAQWMTLNQIAEAQRRAREWDTALPREP